MITVHPWQSVTAELSRKQIDRSITLSIARRLPRFKRNAVPILMYHSISDEDESDRHPYFRTATSPAVFAEQMAFLKANGYTAISLSELTHRLNRPADLLRSVVITFDDGYCDVYRNAFPILQRYGFTATVFLVTHFVADDRRTFLGRACMTWNEVREIAKHGISIGSHTITHPHLRDLDDASLVYEVTASKERIEQEVACAVESFAYPFAFPEMDVDFIERLRSCLITAGYQNGVCTSIGLVNRCSDPLYMSRLPVNSCDDARLFEAKLSGAYDWVATVQHAFKAAKYWSRSFRVVGN